MESKGTVTCVDEESLDVLSNLCESVVHGNISSLVAEDRPENDENDLLLEASAKISTMTFEEMVATINDPISLELAAISHVSQNISSLRRMSHIQWIDQNIPYNGNQTGAKKPPNFVCVCGDADCIDVCDIHEWLPSTTLKLDRKLWELVPLVGKSYLVLGQVYMYNVKLHKTLKVLELACSICGSMPPHLDDTSFISSMGSSSSSQTKFNGKGEYSRSPVDDALKVSSASGDECLTSEPSTYLFWAMAWTLLGDFYIELHQMKKKEISTRTQAKPSIEELGMLSEVEKEFKRLKKLGQDKQNCSYCSLVNCSCQSHRDRASSESTASTSSQDTRPLVYGKKQKKKNHMPRAPLNRLLERLEMTMFSVHWSIKRVLESECLPHKRDGKTNIKASNIVTEKLQVKPLEATKKDEIFKYLGGPVAEELDCYLNAALSCFEGARKACDGLPCDSTELQSAHKKIGWVCNELGKNRLERKELHKAEIVFEDAINAFRKVSDHTSIVVIHGNVGYGRRALADELVLDMENFKTDATWDATRYNLYIKAIEGIKSEYRKSIGHFEAAKTELYFAEETGNVEITNEVYTQMAHTYLSLGMFRAKEEKEGRVAEDTSNREHEISANDAMEKACSLYESLGELRKQEAANAYFQLACYQRDRSLKVLETGHKKRSSCKGENSILQRVKQYADLAERNWLKAMDFYGSKTYPPMYLSILMERATLPLIISSHFHSNAMLESALSYLLEGRHLSDSDSDSDTFRNKNPQLHDAFWHLLQKVLKEMLTLNNLQPTNQTKTE